jgi:hypothetical protein
LLEGKTLSDRLKEGGRLFYVDYVPGFEDYIQKVNAQIKQKGKTNVPWLLKERFQHAGRAVFYYTCALTPAYPCKSEECLRCWHPMLIVAFRQIMGLLTKVMVASRREMGVC